MTLRDEIQAIILEPVQSVLGAEKHVSRPVKEGTGDKIAEAVANRLDEKRELNPGVPMDEVKQRIKSAIFKGEPWNEGSGRHVSPYDCATRIYSGLEFPPTCLIRVTDPE